MKYDAEVNDLLIRDAQLQERISWLTFATKEGSLTATRAIWLAENLKRERDVIWNKLWSIVDADLASKTPSDTPESQT